MLVMSGKNVIKIYLAGGVYHIYNRGVEGRMIFADDRDYRAFLSYLRLYLSEPDTITPIHKNLSGSISLIAYCLMPNHFHLLIQQHDAKDIEIFARAIFGRYSTYFNRRHNRFGRLYQGPYRATLVDTTEQLLTVARYIDRNPQKLAHKLSAYPYGSYRHIGRPAVWLKPNLVMQLFRNTAAYRAYVEGDSLPRESP
jgi:putative transposase